jgi:RHH-type transcriptional regulator, rel operon repressor / antitoxin RelB
MIALNLPPELEKRLDAIVKATGRSKNSVLEEAVAEYVGDIEDLYLAEQESVAIKEGRSTTKPLADIMKQYGLDN